MAAMRRLAPWNLLRVVVRAHVGSDELPKGCKALLDRASRGVDHGIRLAVERFTRSENFSQVIHGFYVASHRPHVALRDHACHMLLGRRLDPDRIAVEQQQLVGLRLRHDATPDAEHDIVLTADDPLETAPFDPTVPRLPIQQEDFGKGDARFALDLPIKLDKGPTQRLRKRAAESGLARAPKADERAALAAHGLVLPEL